MRILSTLIVSRRLEIHWRHSRVGVLGRFCCFFIRHFSLIFSRLALLKPPKRLQGLNPHTTAAALSPRSNKTTLVWHGHSSPGTVSENITRTREYTTRPWCLQPGKLKQDKQGGDMTLFERQIKGHRSCSTCCEREFLSWCWERPHLLEVLWYADERLSSCRADEANEEIHTWHSTREKKEKNKNKKGSGVVGYFQMT